MSCFIHTFTSSVLAYAFSVQGKNLLLYCPQLKASSGDEAFGWNASGMLESELSLVSLYH